MSFLNHNRGKRDPFSLNDGDRRQTSAEIVTEARRSLRTLRTQRPFTPREEHRQLFGETSSRPRDGRPPSAFSLHARNFEAPDSRPSSGTRLSPLDHKPRLPVAPDGSFWEGGAALPKPPSEGPDLRRTAGGAGSKHHRTKSLPRLPPVSQHTEEEAERGRGNAAGSDDTDDSVFWNSEILPVLQELETATAPGRAATEEVVEHLCEAGTRLHDALKQKGMLGRRCKKRSSLLRVLFRLIDLGSDQLNLTLAKLILALSVSGNNLLNICKLVFKISRSASNDVLFQNNSIIDSLLSLLQTGDLSTCCEAVLYCVGSLKLLSGNSALSRLLLAKDLIRILLQLSQRLLQGHTTDTTPDLAYQKTLWPDTAYQKPSAPDTANQKVHRQSQEATTGHILVQLTATLRNMADLSDSRPAFLSNRAFLSLCAVLDHHRDDPDICINVARIFSKLSSYTECCHALAETPSCYRLFLYLLVKYNRKQDLVVRLLFSLGNLTAKNSEARERLFEEEGGIAVLLKLFQTYQGTEPVPDGPTALHKPPPPPNPDREDVLVKLIRVLANVSIHPTAGTALAANAICVQLLLGVLEVRSVEESEELVVNAAATINNLSFYQGESSVVRARHIHVSQLMLKLLLSTSMEGMLEATRVFGNLSQIKEVRHFIMQRKVHQFVMSLLDSKNPDVCFSACGVLINLSVETDNRAVLKEEGVIQKLTDCLRDFGPVDWQLAGLVCQTLWNCTEDGLQQHTHDLLTILNLYLDQDAALPWVSDGDGDDVAEFRRACWELEFLPVAQKLRNRIQSQVTSPEPIGEAS
ncbi:armadillo repeat-containing protein 2 [Chanos chanos]|uniref:Armadillo repeat-containing protein 2 n=1 Tax=Chanos chanos TaxID=29144 RepID=A0A6J2V691_CHACN|nr:armadillo repeat-containing protein 2 [Chanos chanos]